MAPNKSKRFMFMECDSWRKKIGDSGWDMFPVLAICCDIFPACFKDFASVLRKFIFKNISSGRFSVLYTKISIQMNFSTLIFQDKIHQRFAREKMLTTFETFSLKFT